jgi:DNA-binding MarR family transcriptional regulator
MDEKKLEDIADRMHIFLPFFYRKVMAWHKNAEGFNPGHYMIMGTLMKAGPMSMSDLGRRICSSKPGVTFLTDRLIEEGLLERTYDENDRRVIHVSLTGKGKAFMSKHRIEEKEEMKKNLSKLSDDDLEALCESLNKLREIFIKVCEEDKNVKQESG